ncbi:MAG: aldolase/citrate lyase family protein [Caldilineaceae bacterium]
MRLLAMIETARGVINAAAIAGASPRMERADLWRRGLCGERGCAAAPRLELFYARSAVVTAAAAYGLQAIDMIFTELDNATDLAAECAFAALGFVGKTAIHPAQLAPINAVLTPTPQEIAHAERLLAAYDAPPRAPAFELDGRMVDRPMVRRRGEVLARAGRGVKRGRET